MSKPTTQPDFSCLRTFRQRAYELFTHSKDAFFDLMDAVLQTPHAGSFVELSLAPAFRRQWSSVYQATEAARYDEAALNELCLSQVPTEQVAHFAIDVTGMRRITAARVVTLSLARPFVALIRRLGGPPEEAIGFEDAQHGSVKMQMWRDLGWRQDGKFIAVDLICSQIHTERAQPPEAHWCTAYNGKSEQTITLKGWYDTIAHRWGLEPANRLRKQRLFADLPKVRAASSSDHCQQRVQLLEWELYLARDLVTQKVLPWQKPLAPADITPNRVIQSLPAEPARPFIATRYTGRRGTTTRKCAGLADGQSQKRPQEVQTDTQAPQKGPSLSMSA